VRCSSAFALIMTGSRGGVIRVRRPVLSLATALRLVDVSRVTQLEGSASWLGALRHRLRLRRCTRNDFALGRLAAQERSVLIETPGGDSRRCRQLTRTLDNELRSRGVCAETPHDAPSRGEAAESLDPWTPDDGRHDPGRDRPENPEPRACPRGARMEE
jgi:hypothetical protein